MLPRPAPGLRLVVVGALLAALFAHAVPARTFAAITPRSTAITTTIPVGDTLAIASQRGDGQLTLSTRERSPLTPAVIAIAGAPARRAPRRYVTMPAPHARSHAVRYRVRAADDPPSH